MFKKLLQNVKRNKIVKEVTTKKLDKEEMIESFNNIKKDIIYLESLEPSYEIVARIQKLKTKLNMPLEFLKEMDETDICFYVLNSDSFKSLAEYTENVTPEVEKILYKLTREEVVYKYSMEDSVNLIYFYGNLLSHEGIVNLVYNIIDKCHGDMGVYTTIVKNLAELNHIEGIEIIYSAITFKYGEEVAKRLMVKLGIEADFSKLNKVI